MDSNDRRIKEANGCLRKAEECLKTSLFSLKLKPNYDSAAYEYERAAVCFKNAGRLNSCLEAYLEAAKCHSQNKNIFHNAKSLENAANICRDMKDYCKSVELLTSSADLFFSSGNAIVAAQTIEKAALLLEQQRQLSDAIKLYETGIYYADGGETQKTTLKFMQRIIMLCLRMDDMESAIKNSSALIQKHLDLQEMGKIGEIVLGIVLMELKRGDSVSALNALNKIPGPHRVTLANQISGVNQLVKAYDDSDDHAFQTILKGGVWRSIGDEYLRLAKDLNASPITSNKQTEQRASSFPRTETKFDDDDLR